MRFMVFVRANEFSEGGGAPSSELLGEMMQYNKALSEAGVLVAGEGLAPSADGARVAFAGRERRVSRGPFAAEDLVAGYWIFEAASLEDAIGWVRRAPNPTGETGEIEIRRILGPEDFAASDPSGELREGERALRAALEARA